MGAAGNRNNRLYVLNFLLCGDSSFWHLPGRGLLAGPEVLTSICTPARGRTKGRCHRGPIHQGRRPGCIHRSLDWELLRGRAWRLCACCISAVPPACSAPSAGSWRWSVTFKRARCIPSSACCATRLVIAPNSANTRRASAWRLTSSRPPAGSACRALPRCAASSASGRSTSCTPMATRPTWSACWPPWAPVAASCRHRMGGASRRI